MKGDIAVAGFMMTAEEWQALDSGSRAQLVAVITRQDPMFASGSGPVVAQPRVASGTVPPVRLAEGTSPVQLTDSPMPLADRASTVQLAEGTNPGIDVPDLIEELPSGAVIADPS